MIAVPPLPSARTAANNGVGRGRPAGFTLVELLVAAAAVAVLLAVAVEVGQYVRGQGLTRFTLELLGQVQAAADQYKDLHGRWPADRFDRQRVAPGPEHQPQTEGVECLVLALGPLHPPFWQARPYQRAWANTDGDSNRIDRQGLLEWVDGWGRALLYYNGGGAGAGKDGLGLPCFAGYDEAAMGKLNESLVLRWGHNIDRRPVLDSAGPDGVFNNSDDVQRAGSGRPTRP